MAKQPQGAARVLKRLLGMSSAELPKAITRELYMLGQKIELTAEKSITSGSISGAGHIPSSPGEPPNADTRHLDTNIETEVDATGRPRITVTSYAGYSAALEYGTSRMAARPFMRPATAKHKDEVTGGVAAVVSIIVKKG